MAKTESLIIFIEEKLAINSLLDLEFVKFFTPVASKIPKFFNSTREKRIYRDIFGQKLRMGDVLLIHFEQIVSFVRLSTQILTHSSWFEKTLG